MGLEDGVASQTGNGGARYVCFYESPLGFDMGCTGKNRRTHEDEERNGDGRLGGDPGERG